MAPEIVRFQETDIRVESADGQKWVVIRDLAIALGYSDQLRLFALIDRNSQEFSGKQGVIKMSTPGGMQEIRVINYHGVIRVAMKSDAPRAIPFRDWAEEVLFQVMTKGSYAVQAAQPDNRHWTEQLAPTDRLKLVEIRVRIGMKMAEDIDNPVYHGLMSETYGGFDGMKEYREKKGLPARERPRPARKTMSKLDRDPEQRLFVEDCLQRGTMTLEEISILAKTKFGAERGVARNIIWRHYHKMKARKAERAAMRAAQSERTIN